MPFSFPPAHRPGGDDSNQIAAHRKSASDQLPSIRPAKSEPAFFRAAVLLIGHDFRRIEKHLFGFRHGNAMFDFALLQIAFIPIEAGDFAQIEHFEIVYAGDGKRKSISKVDD
jgi:hypothetical protein